MKWIVVNSKKGIIIMIIIIIVCNEPQDDVNDNKML
jgi:hypothetical protein